MALVSIITFENLILDPLPETRNGRQLYAVREDCTVRLNGSYLTVLEAGFVTDLTSWPHQLYRWPFTSFGFVRKWLSGKIEKYDPPAVLHDHLLETTSRPKWEVDALYHLALRSKGVSALESFLFGQAVRVRRSR